MKTCVFFGNGDCPAEVEPFLEKLVQDLIENRGVDFFYADCKGAFSLMAARVLRNLAPVYPEVEYALVETWQEFLEDTKEKEAQGGFPKTFGPENYEAWSQAVQSDRILPEGVENVPSSSARSYCHRWMLNQAEIVVAWIIHKQGSAANAVETAKHRGVEVIMLSDKW